MTIVLYILLGIVWLMAGIATIGFLAYRDPQFWSKIDNDQEIRAWAAIAIIFWPVAWVTVAILWLAYLVGDIITYAAARRTEKETRRWSSH